MNCQPCKEQKKQTTAANWCIECEEALCNECNVQHKAFKLSRNHTVNPISTVDEKQHVMSSCGVLDETAFCGEHGDQTLDFFCQKHGTLCCSVCKSVHHKDCSDVEKIDDTVDEAKVSDLRQRLLDIMEKRKTELGILLNNQNSEFDVLGTAKENFLKEMTEQRAKLNEMLNHFEDEVKQEMNDRHNQAVDQINALTAVLQGKITGISEIQQTINDISMKTSPPAKIRFVKMAIKGSQDVEMTNNEATEKTAFAQPNYKFSYVFNKERKDIQISYQTTVQLSDVVDAQSKTPEDSAECGSSVVELEPLEASISALPKENSLKSSANQDGASQMLENSAQESDYQERQFPSPERWCVPSYSPYPYNTSGTDNSYFNLEDSFFVEKRNKDIFLNDVKWIPGTSELVMIETFDPRCLIYDQSGQKKVQLFLRGSPWCLTILDDGRRVAITLDDKREIIILDTHDLQFLSCIRMQDHCKGISCMDDKLLVNCVHDGLQVMSDSGYEFDEFEEMAGELYLHVDSHGKLYSAKKNSRSIHVLNMRNENRSIYHLKGLECPVGITTDEENNVLVSCNNSDQILMKESLHSSAVVLLDEDDGIDRPLSIDYDKQSDRLVVVNNDGHSIFVFRKY